jgi:hypothetical protein
MKNATSDILSYAESLRFISAPPGKPVNAIGHGQNARTTGGAGILPAASLLRNASGLLSAQRVRTSMACCGKVIFPPF